MADFSETLSRVASWWVFQVKYDVDPGLNIGGNMLKTFRAISLLEGLSFLIILSVTFGMIGRDYVFAFGMAHGVLFLLYLVLSLLICSQQNWSLKIWLPLFFASMVPFAFLPVDLYLKRASFAQAPAAA